jgi:hypothetical protein
MKEGVVLKMSVIRNHCVKKTVAELVGSVDQYP